MYVRRKQSRPMNYVSQTYISRGDTESSVSSLSLLCSASHTLPAEKRVGLFPDEPSIPRQNYLAQSHEYIKSPFNLSIRFILPHRSLPLHLLSASLATAPDLNSFPSCTEPISLARGPSRMRCTRQGSKAPLLSWRSQIHHAHDLIARSS